MAKLIGQQRVGTRHMSLWISISVASVLIGMGGAVFFWMWGPERLWMLFGPPDLGPVTFETLTRSPKPNDALACPSGFCPGDGDIFPPIFDVDVPVLRKALLNALKTERRLTRVHIDDQMPADRFVQRSDTLHFPDTIVVRYLALPDNHSTVAIYSRSQLGHSDLGVNHARIERWLRKLSREVRAMREGA